MSFVALVLLAPVAGHAAQCPEKDGGQAVVKTQRARKNPFPIYIGGHLRRVTIRKS